MKLKKYYKRLNAEEKKAFAEKIGASLAYFRHLANGRRNASHKLAKKIEEATERAVTREELRPDIYE